jgi:hypothetical protein
MTSKLNLDKGFPDGAGTGSCRNSVSMTGTVTDPGLRWDDAEALGVIRILQSPEAWAHCSP